MPPGMPARGMPPGSPRWVFESPVAIGVGRGASSGNFPSMHTQSVTRFARGTKLKFGCYAHTNTNGGRRGQNARGKKNRRVSARETCCNVSNHDVRIYKPKHEEVLPQRSRSGKHSNAAARRTAPLSEARHQGWRRPAREPWWCPGLEALVEARRREGRRPGRLGGCRREDRHQGGHHQGGRHQVCVSRSP